METKHLLQFLQSLAGLFSMLLLICIQSYMGTHTDWLGTGWNVGCVILDIALLVLLVGYIYRDFIKTSNNV